MRRGFRMSFETRQKVGVLVFCLPFILGFTLFFLYPLIQAMIFSLNKLVLTPDGYDLNFQGIANYQYALFIDPNFTRTFVESLGKLGGHLPFIIAFSFFAATIINQKFRGRTLARVILFLPVILAAGVVVKLEQGDYAAIMASQTRNVVFGGSALRSLLATAKLPGWFLDYATNAISAVPTIIRQSGVQTLIFLAGLQSIPSQVYESADVEGATAWESFWLITFPMLSPLLVTNTVYTVVDSFTAMDNALVKLIQDTAFTGAGFGVSMAMSMIYFGAVGLILAVVYSVIAKHAFYNV